MQYIILDGKTPTHGFKNGEGAKSWSEAKDFDNVAVIVPDGYVVLDFDTTSDAEIMLNIVDALDLKCRVMKRQEVFTVGSNHRRRIQRTL
mgnify:CR=1 FL=1